MIKLFFGNEINRCEEYDNYIKTHQECVKRAYDEFFAQKLHDDLKSICESIIISHDMSKWEDEEYNAYADYFYRDNKDQEAFDRAFLHHIHNNPHHWQHWVLIHDTDEPKEVALDMPEKYVIEMLCDWHSFSYFRDPESTAKKWYSDNKDKMIFSDNTKVLIDKYLTYFD